MTHAIKNCRAFEGGEGGGGGGYTERDHNDLHEEIQRY